MAIDFDVFDSKPLLSGDIVYEDTTLPPEPGEPSMLASHITEPEMMKSHDIGNPVANIIVERLGGNQKHLDDFMKLVKTVESDNSTTARNPTSSATGLYQYIDGSIQPAINRTKRMIGDADWLNSLEKHKDVTKLTEEQYDTLFLADLYQRKGTDAQFKKILKGDVESMKKLYKEKHHTRPDKATLKRLDEVVNSIFKG